MRKLMSKTGIKSPVLFKVLMAVGCAVILGLAVLYILVLRDVPVMTVAAAEDVAPTVPEPAETSPPARIPIMVQVSGSVYNPGEFWMYEGDRVLHAIERAGGMTEYADEAAFNRTLPLYDTMHIFVYSIFDNMPPATPSSSNGGGMVGGLVNINTATMAQLQTLSGIGEARARDIIAHREARGGFATIEEIMNVPGIAEGIFSRIQDQITVN